jgi:hypothetical protein
MTKSEATVLQQLSEQVAEHGKMLGEIRVALLGYNGHGGGILAELADHEQRLSLAETKLPELVTDTACHARHSKAADRKRDGAWKTAALVLAAVGGVRLVLELTGVL